MEMADPVGIELLEIERADSVEHFLRDGGCATKQV
jgi:hypothetical protein